MTPVPHEAEPRYASRGSLKLLHALDTFDLDVQGCVCADFGCSTGGFTDVLLRRGAARVYSVDTAYGQLDYRLRTDERVTVMERTNALHATPPDEDRPSIIVMDLGWTRQARAVPAALMWLVDDPNARIVSLIKPHYELDKAQFEAEAERGVLAPERAEAIAQAVAADAPAWGARVLAITASPVLGGAAGSRKRGKRKNADKVKGGGNVEYLALMARTESMGEDG
ncbi:MAG: SAM-dependent methyltransferase [Planctomycetota bacterium]